jgi:hypothetical protein
MEYSYLHEAERVRLRSATPRPRLELLEVLTSQGFSLHEDVLSLDRGGKIPPWQHPSIVEITVFHEDEEVFGFDEGVWDAIELNYLFASLPFENVERFLAIVAATCERLSLCPEFRGKTTTVESLRVEFDRIRDEVQSQTGETPGSEGLAILIHSTYPRP